MEILNLPINVIKATGATQSRVSLSETAVSEYAEFIRLGGDLPPVVVYEDGSDIWLADGFHRFHAHRAAGAVEIACEVRSGTKRDAILFSAGANASHGLRRTNEDKRRAVLTLLEDAEWSKWSDNQIAKACSVSNHLVSDVKASLTLNSPSENPAERTYTTKHGTTATMSTANIGKAKQVAHGEIRLPKADKQISEAAAAPAKPAANDADPDDDQKVVQIARDELAELREQIEELQASLKETLADNEMMGRVFDADDKLKAAMDEAKRQKAIADNAERSLAAKQGEFKARAEQVTYWKNRAQKAEKSLAKAAA